MCGHYEGIDERAYALADRTISLGDYVLTSGELASMVVIDAVVRKLPGVLGAPTGAQGESFADGLLEYPQYTRPATFRGMDVPAGAALGRPRRRGPLEARAEPRAHGAPAPRPAGRRRPHGCRPRVSATLGGRVRALGPHNAREGGAMDHGRHARTGAPSAPRRVVGALWWAAFVLVLAWLQVTFVHQAFAVPSGSMEGTIMTGDRVYAEKVSYLFRDPEPGDIVTFQDPEIPGRVLIKRCIAVGGQTVDLVDGRVVVDGVALDEPYTRGLPSEPLKTALGVEVSYPYTVPAGHLWVMGDNRTNSNDSRYFGAVARSSVTARGVAVIWPLEDAALIG